MTTRWFSLRRRLLVWLLAGMTLGWLAAVAVTYVEARKEIMEALDKRARHDGHEQRFDRLEKKVQKELAEHLIEALLSPLLLGLPLLGGWIWFATWRGLQPLDEMAHEIAQRAPERLDPVAPQEAPREIRPLIDALNALLARVAQAMENERAFTADAAHELRTPLAAIVAQAQVAARAGDEVERDHALTQLIVSARRAGHLVEQLLTLARLDPAAELPMSELRLDLLAAEVCADHGAQAVAKSISLELTAPQPVSLAANDAMLRVLLRNLLDNALRYTPTGGKVGVSITADDGGVRLRVCDNGPGIPPEQRPQALRRLHRLAGQEIEGCGLGLAIVARIVELHHARLDLDVGLDGHGLCVTVSFGAEEYAARCQ